MPEQFSAKKTGGVKRQELATLSEVFSARKYRGGGGSRDKTGVRTIECQKKAQMESKSKRIGIHTCFQASTETPDLDDCRCAKLKSKARHFYQTNLAKVLERVVAHLRVSF